MGVEACVGGVAVAEADPAPSALTLDLRSRGLLVRGSLAGFSLSDATDGAGPSRDSLGGSRTNGCRTCSISVVPPGVQNGPRQPRLHPQMPETRLPPIQVFANQTPPPIVLIDR